MVSAKEIAERLGVSPTTVSLVLNNKKGVGSETRRRILALAKELGYNKKYHPLPGPERTVRLVIFKNERESIVNSFPEYVTEGVTTRAEQLGFTVQISYITRKDLLRQPVSTLFSESSGIILFGTEASRSDLAMLTDLKAPVVLLDNCYDDLSFNTVMIGNRQGVFNAVKYLIDNGHTNIGFAGSSRDLASFAERQEGFLKAVTSDPRTKKSEDNIFVLPSTIHDIYESFRQQLITLKEIPTAFVLRYDLIANICYQVFNDLGYSIPDDISVIGFDNNPICELITPKLTTVAVPMQSIGILAINRLEEMMSGTAQENVRIDVLPKLLIRDSVKRI